MKLISKNTHVVELGNAKTFIANKHQLSTIGRLRYLSYFNAQAIDKLDNENFVDKYDNQNNSINHIATFNDEFVGSIRGCIYDPINNPEATIPSLEIFHREIEEEVGLHYKIFESCRFVITPNLKKAFYTNLALIKTNCLLSYISDCTTTITAVRESHVEFYKKMGFVKCSKPKTYPGLKIKMVLLIVKETKKQIDSFETSFRLLAQTESERKNYKACLSQLH